MTLKFLLLAVLGLASVTADFNATASLDFSANALDQANCAAKAYGYDATTHDRSAIGRPGALWNDFEGGDYSGFVYGGTGDFGLTIAIPTLYEAEKTTVAFQDAATAGGAASDMASATDASDSWTCSTCQAWYGNGNAPIDADTCTEDAFGDCFAVFRYKKSWALFTADMGIGGKGDGKGLERIEYGGAPTIGTEGVAFNGGGDGTAVAGLAPQKFIEFCGEMVVTMWEVPVNGWPQESSTFSADAVTIARHVTDRFVFCLVFQTRVAVSTDLTIHDQPDYFQLLRIQDNAMLNPDNATCPAKYELSIITLVQWPYELENFAVDADDADTPYEPEHNSLDFARQTDKGYGDADCELAPGQDNCAQDWGISFCLVDCEADGDLVLNFEVKCRDNILEVDCPLTPGVTTNVGGVITLDSASFCATLIESLTVEGSLASFVDDTLLTAKDTFVTGDRVCFKGEFKAIDDQGNDLASPDICGVSIMQIDLHAESDGIDGGYFTEDIWTGPAWPSSAGAPYTDTDVVSCQAAGRTCSYGTYADTLGNNDLNLVIFNYATGNAALGATGLNGRVKNIGFCYDLDDVLLAPEDHGSFNLETNVLVEVVFCDTAVSLLSLVYPYKQALYEAAGTGKELLALDDQAQNPNEVGATLGMTSVRPLTPSCGPGQPTPCCPSTDPRCEKTVTTKTAQPVTKPANDIWPIVAGIIGAVSVVIIVLLVAMRRRRTDNVKTVAVIPTNTNYGQVAVVTQNNVGAVP
jgi:hypothetical protein